MWPFVRNAIRHNMLVAKVKDLPRALHPRTATGKSAAHLAMTGIAKADLTWNSVKGVMFDDSFQLERLAKPPLSSVPMTTTEVEDVRRPG